MSRIVIPQNKWKIHLTQIRKSAHVYSAQQKIVIVH